MSEAWVIVLTVGLGTMVIKAAGPVLLGDRPLPSSVQRVVALLAPALLAALVATTAFASGQQLALDARAAGLAVAAVAIALRAPVLVVVILAAAVAAVTPTGRGRLGPGQPAGCRYEATISSYGHEEAARRTGRLLHRSSAYAISCRVCA